ncbi:MAG: hypothetical protein QF896_07425 [Acidimicrobiales bacterium]|jgi:hypothetical protein|nr:hypothetical protein [Acidimicrobiales bacterium]|tara:strand:- start:3382 stop:3930 length:549 start_codon:yes stop_codon:yes gene_type:complete
MEQPTTAELDAGLDDVRNSPTDNGSLDLIVRRPDVDEREVLEVGELSVDEGLVGDNWIRKPSSRTDDGGPHPGMQLNLINSRVLTLVCPDPDRRALAGDQLVVDMDLTESNLPAWTRLAIGSAIIEVTDQPHKPCAKFSRRFGVESYRFVNSEAGKALNLRGINARVVQPGTITKGDTVRKL